ncbi:hypothetical protein MPSEU_000718400 [Mayamaea pseudoterrestris]|nr:hypothetical protein MPSEU_000718400 [Mayamaea pseudoterrestris]
MRCMAPKIRVIDSHLHVWADTQEAANAFPYAQPPPETIKNDGSIDALIKQMDSNGVDGALVVQPINHKFDHSYVIQAIKDHPHRFKGMLLHDPDDNDPIARIEELCLKGFVGVRFNPYLWPRTGDKKWKSMAEGISLDVYKRCGELKLPVGIMCFQGISLHYDDIVQLLEQSPATMCILDHFGFTSLKNSLSFEQLLSLSKYPQLYVKISALFRLGGVHPYDKVKEERFLPLLRTFGSKRLLFGSDFPYVLGQPAAYSVHKLVEAWIEDVQDRRNIMSQTAERLFGAWS